MKAKLLFLYSSNVTLEYKFSKPENNIIFFFFIKTCISSFIGSWPGLIWFLEETSIYSVVDHFNQLSITKVWHFLYENHNVAFWELFIVCYRLSRNVCVFGGLIQLIFIRSLQKNFWHNYFSFSYFTVFLLSIVASLFLLLLSQKKRKKEYCLKKLLQIVIQIIIILINHKNSCFFN